MKILKASISAIVWRYYLMMGIVIAAFFLKVPYIAIIAFPIFLSALLGVSFKKDKVNVKQAAHSMQVSAKLFEKAA